MRKLGLLIVLLGCSEENKPQPQPKPEAAIEEWVINAESFLAPLRKISVSLDVLPSVIRSAEIDPKQHVPVEGAKAFWVTPDKKSVVVDKKLFSDLTRANAASLASGKSAAIGTLADLKMAPRDVVRTLLLAHVIQTYMHIEATVKLVKESQDDARYEAVFSAVHVFYTNQKNETAYSFAVILNKKTGDITVERR